MSLFSIQRLESFADWLASDPKDIAIGKELAEKLRRCLEDAFSIDRFYVAGSVGKGTAIRYPLDFDCVFFLNLQNHPLEKFEEVKKKFFEVRYECIIIIICSVKYCITDIVNLLLLCKRLFQV